MSSPRPVAPSAAPPASAPLDEDLGARLHVDPLACAREARGRAEAAAARGDRVAELVASHYLATAVRLTGSDDEVLAICDRIDALAESLDEPVWQARGMQTRALVHHEAGDDETAVDLLEGAVDRCRAAGDTAALADALTLLGRTFAELPGFTSRAASTLATARRLWLACSDPDGAVAAQLSLAITYLATGRELSAGNPAGAAAAARQAMSAARLAVREADEAGLTELAVDARLAVVDALLELDAPPAELDAALASTAGLLARFPLPHQQLVLHRHTALHLSRQGAADAAVAEARRGLALAALGVRSRGREALLRLLGDLLQTTGDLAGAVEALTELNASLEHRARLSAERRSAVISARLDTERARRAADRERRRAAELEQRNAELAWAADHDQLTGLANRRAFDAVLGAATAGTTRPLSLCLVDVDRFKQINDTISHQAGDRVLVGLAQVMRSAVRHGDLSARFGGEEFALVLPGADAAAATLVAERLRTAVEQLWWPYEMPDGRVTVSIGVTTATGPVTGDELVARADEALYAAKRAGRNRVVQR